MIITGKASAPDSHAPLGGAHPRQARVWVCVTYAIQGLNGAAVSTTLPGLSSREHISLNVISLLVLLGGIMAGVGSLLAGRWARHQGSHSLLLPGLILQAATIALILINLSLPLLFVVFALYGVGIGIVDAGNGMQSITVQALYGKSIMNLFFAFQTMAAIVGALLVAAITGTGAPFDVPLVVVIAIGVAAAFASRGRLSADPEAARVPQSEQQPVRPQLPWRGILVFGLVIGVVYIGDSSIGTWSSIFLSRDLRSAALIAPLGYASYQALVLVARLFGDHLVRRAGRTTAVALGTVIAGVGFLEVSLSPHAAFAVIGFALVGLGLGVIVPVSFSAAGELATDRIDEIVARLNVFNYLGVIVGSVSVGLIASGVGLATAFLLPAILILALLLTVHAYRPHPVSPESPAS